jgi:hypothetical protein
MHPRLASDEDGENMAVQPREATRGMLPEHLECGLQMPAIHRARATAEQDRKAVHLGEVPQCQAREAG